MGITYNEVIENELIKENVISRVPKICECGSEIIFSENLKKAYCSNSQCFYKTAYKINRLAKYYELKSITLDKSIDICKKYKLKTPFQITLLDAETLEAYKIKEDVEELKNGEYSLYDLAIMIMSEDIAVIAEKLLYGYNSLKEFYDDIDKYQLPLISERLGIENIEATALSAKIYSELNDLKEELLFGETQLNIKKDDRKRLNIVITGKLVKYLNKSEYMHLLRSLNTKYRIILMTTVNSNTDVLINDNNLLDSKVSIARRINEETVAMNVKAGILDIEDAGKVVKGLYPVGYRILITDAEGLIKKLEELG